jgi:hypothetical protein
MMFAKQILANDLSEISIFCFLQKLSPVCFNSTEYANSKEKNAWE